MTRRIAARAEWLSRASLPFRDAFQPLLDTAPDAALQRMLAGIAPAATEQRLQGPSRRRLLGALAASLAVGVVADRLWLRLAEGMDDDEAHRWREVVAQYMTLYTPATLEGAVPGRESQMAQLSAVNRLLGLSLTPEAVAIAGAEFRRVQLLAYDGQPLAQIAYLDPPNRAAGPLHPAPDRRARRADAGGAAGAEHRLLVGAGPCPSVDRSGAVASAFGGGGWPPAARQHLTVWAIADRGSRPQRRPDPTRTPSTP